VVGFVSYLYTVSNNVGLEGMAMLGGASGSGFTIVEQNGADITVAQAKMASFWTTTTATWVGWNTNVWDFANGRLPILRNVGGNQTANNPPAHLQ
jgi:hypothetical protein